MFINQILFAFLVAASTVHSQLDGIKSTDYLEIYSGADFAKGLADTGAPAVLVLANDYTLVTEDSFAGLTLPVVLRRNVTVQGRPDRWATLNTTHTKQWLALDDKVTLTLRWVVLFDLFNDVSSGASAELLTDMPTGTIGTLILRHAAYSTEFCYPASTVTDYLGRSERPSSFPGTNKYNATSTVPSSLKAMGGGPGSFDSIGESGSGAVSCTNNILGPPMRRCWGHVAYIEDFAIAGGFFDRGRVYVKNGYDVNLKDSYMLCGRVLDVTCVMLLTPYGCLKAIQTPPSTSSISEPALVTSSKGSIAPSRESAGGDSGSPSQNNRGRGSTTVVLASVIAGGFAVGAVAVVVAIFVVKRLRQRRRQQTAAEVGTNAQYGRNGAKNLTGEDGDYGAPGEGSSATSRRTPAAEESDGRGGDEGGGGNVTAAVAVGGRAAIAAAATELRPNNIDFGHARGDLVVGKALHANAGGPPPLSGLPSPDGDTGRVAATLHGSASSSEWQQRQQQQQQQDDGEDLPSRPVVVTPFTPFRPDLQLYQNLEQELTLLPVIRGKGSYGKVCEGMYGGQCVAVKLVRDVFGGPGHNASDKVMTTFAQEVEVLGRCRHPNVVRLLAACVQPPRLCLVMELMEISLQRLVFGDPTKGLLPLPKVLHIGCEIARAMEYLHPTIVHRDLKPDNVLISKPDSPEPIVKVSDFGLARLRCTVSPTMHPEAGTPSYMAPECFDLGVTCITHHVDIFSWAVVIWTMLSGVEPWAGYGVVEIAYRVTLMNERPMLDNLVASGRCPPRLQRLLTRCWNRTPELRPAAAEIVKEIMLIMQQQERLIIRLKMESNYMASPGSVLSRIREYQDAVAAAVTSATSTGITTTTTTTITTTTATTTSTYTADGHGYITTAVTATTTTAAADASAGSSPTEIEGVYVDSWKEAVALASPAAVLPPPPPSPSLPSLELPLPPASLYPCMGSGALGSPYAPAATAAADAASAPAADAAATSCKDAGSVVNVNQFHAAVGVGRPTTTMAANAVDSGTSGSRGRTRWFTVESFRAALFGSRS
ncbi:hypothetical protein VaNZ11_009831 [Volvox africanus]|uniref:Protein kinase domain-containing protein n=1 Tax=Volvox africanus TaxID=51714 RepID=A0ABQ5S8A0_9CHLO|nr:hypothetical protein VaNZ11_009831 [Volvox africanus]